MSDTLIDVPAARLQTAKPDPRVGVRAGRSEFDAADMWRDAQAVLVSRVIGPRQVKTVPRLVVPVGPTQIAYRVSTYSAEAAQLAADGRVLVQPGDWRGNPVLGSHQRQGRAQLVTAGTLLPYVQSELAAKYRWRMPLARLAHRLMHGVAPYGDVVVLVTVFEPSPIPLPAADRPDQCE
ncbi:hypothetical protein [Nocardia sp. NPDC050406]|uniref:hypothetical protein n=1 Tax=Nocardia sp. NPDC050406 TaxID=3364318 RepID=UPI0037B7FA3E